MCELSPADNCIFVFCATKNEVFLLALEKAVAFLVIYMIVCVLFL